MQVLVEIPDNKLNFALEVLRSLAFVKKAKPMSNEKPIFLPYYTRQEKTPCCTIFKPV